MGLNWPHVALYAPGLLNSLKQPLLYWLSPRSATASGFWLAVRLAGASCLHELVVSPPGQAMSPTAARTRSCEATTTEVAGDAAGVLDPPALLAVSCTFSVWPTSAATGT